MKDKDPQSPRWIRWLPLGYLLIGLAWILGSDYLLGWLFQDDAEGLLLAGTLKGVLFVVLTAILLYVALALRWSPAASRPGADASLEGRMWQPVITFLVSALLIVVVGQGLYMRQASHIKGEAAQRLQLQAESSSHHIGQWFAGNVRSMLQTANNPFASQALVAWLANDDPEIAAFVAQRLDAIRLANEFEGVGLFDTRGRGLAAVGEAITVSPALSAAIERAIGSRGVEHTGFYGEPLAIEFVVAIDRTGAGDSAPVALIVARVHAEPTLSSLLGPADAGYRTGETLLVSKENDRLLYLGGLKQHSSLPPDAAVPLSRDDLAAVRLAQGAQGAQGAVEAFDYRGHPVIAVAQDVPGTPWMLVSKVDRDETQGPVLRLFMVAAGLALAAIMASAGLVWMWWRGERLRVGLQLAEAEARADSLAARFGWVNRHATDVILLFDAQGRVLDANDRAVHAYGYARAELLALTALDLWDTEPSEQERAGRLFAAVRDTGGLLFETRHRRKDGSTFSVEVSSGLVEVDGQRYVQSIVRDIGERKAQEARIAQLAADRDRTLAQLQLQFERMPIGAMVTGPGLLGMQVNPACERIFGYTQAELDRCPRPYELIVPPELHEELLRRLASLETEDVSITHVHDNLTKDGRRITCRWSNTSLRGEDGRFLGILAMCEDITEQLQAERALRASEERFRVLADVSPVGIFRCDARGRCSYVNSRWCEIAGMSAEEALGDGWQRAMHPDDGRALLPQWQEMLAGRPFRAEYRFGRHGDRWNWVLGQALTEQDEHGRMVGIVGTITDITDLKAALAAVEEARGTLEQRVNERTQELLEAKERAERADKVKSSFLSMMSHELRTPLNSILGFTDVLLQRFAGPLTAEQERQLGIVRDSSVHLLALINDVLDISRIEAGQLRLEIGVLDLPDLLRRRVRAFETLAAAKSLELECRVGPGVGELRSDAKRVAQIVTNLLSNAVKFTDAGRVALEARATDAGVEIEVSDTGHGIAVDELPRLFTAFERLTQSGRRMTDGTGLGLAISRHLVRALGGDIRVESELGKGSRFTVVLPSEAPSDADISESGIFRRPDLRGGP